MKKEDKGALIKEIARLAQEYAHFYVVDLEGLNAGQTSSLRRKCFEQEIKLMVVKNTLFIKALESIDANAFEELRPALKGNTAIMFCNTGNVPAKLIKESLKAQEKPALKAAFVEQSLYMGANQLDALVAVKSKNELIADVVALLQSPIKNVVSGLQGSAGNKIHALLQTLEKRA